MESETEQLHWEYELVLATRKDLQIAINAIRRAIEREAELGPSGLSSRLDLIKDELLSFV